MYVDGVFAAAVEFAEDHGRYQAFDSSLPTAFPGLEAWTIERVGIDDDISEKTYLGGC